MNKSLKAKIKYKQIRLLAAFSLIFLSSVSCDRSQEEILIGEFASLTGGTATFGQSCNKGIQLAVKEINSAGGIRGKMVKVIVEDDQSKTEEVRNAILKLIQQDKVIAVLGEVASSRSLAAAPECQSAQVPMITPASTNPKVTEVGDYIFRVCFIDPFQGEIMAKFAYESLGVRKAGIFRDIKNEYSVGLADFFKRTFTNLGGEIVVDESYYEGDMEFRAQLTTIKAQSPEALFIPGYYTEVGLIARQARELGIKVPLLGGDGWDSAKTVEIGGEAVNDSYYSNHYHVDDPSPLVKDFVSKFNAEYKERPDAMAVLGYDAAKILANAIDKAAEEGGEEFMKAILSRGIGSGAQGEKASQEVKKARRSIRDNIASIKDFPGVSGSITIDEHRNAKKSIVILKIEGGTVKFNSSIKP